jgi:hypothetical protein
LFDSLHRALIKGGQIKAIFHAEGSMDDILWALSQASKDEKYQSYFENFGSFPFRFGNKEFLENYLIKSGKFKGEVNVKETMYTQSRVDFKHRVKRYLKQQFKKNLIKNRSK